MPLNGVPGSGVPAAGGAAGAGATRVLLVDDEADLRAALAIGLGAAGFEVAQAATGTEALDAVGRGDVDVLVLDVNLPDIDGFEVLRRLPDPRPVPVVLVSASASTATARLAQLQGCVGYLVKPFPSGALVALVRDAAAGRRGGAGSR
jgi:DNA-binding response OmpR family regulator